MPTDRKTVKLVKNTVRGILIFMIFKLTKRNHQKQINTELISNMVYTRKNLRFSYGPGQGYKYLKT